MAVIHSAGNFRSVRDFSLHDISVHPTVIRGVRESYPLSG
jgi:hypothetical protein